MNYQLLNKKWSSYYNWTITYPAYFIIFIIIGMAGIIYSGFNESYEDYTSATAMFFSVYFIIIGFLVAIIPYVLWFIIASDSLAKTLGWNRLLFNILNIFALFSCLYFITILVFWIKIKDQFEEAGYDTTFTGKLK